MKKKLFVLLALVVSVIISLSVGVAAFSRDNIDNRIKDRDSALLESEKGMTLISLEGQLFVRLDVDLSNVKNLKLGMWLPDDATSVGLVPTGVDGMPTDTSALTVLMIERKNNDIYCRVPDGLDGSIRFALLTPKNANHIEFVETNPTSLNYNYSSIILYLVLPLAIMVSTLYLFLDRESLKKDLFAMKRYKYLLYDLVTKDLKTKYRRSALGVLWSVLNPLLMMLVLTAVFSNIIRVEVEGGFALFYLTGYILFNFISESTGFALYTVTSAAPLIKKVYIPKYIFPLQKCIFSFVNMLFSLIAFVIVFVVFALMGRISPSPTMLMFPIPMLLIFVFSLGLSLILSAVMVFFRDIGHIWGILLTVWMYASPIIYPISMVPDWLKSVIRLNPLYYYIDYFRSVMIYGRLTGFGELCTAILWSVAMLLVGAVIFRKSQDKFVLYV